MDGILKVLGFESKPDYSDKIPERLTSADFHVHNTFRHGFAHQPTCLDYDPVQQLLAIGTQNGRVVLLGKPGLERHMSHPRNEYVLQIKFVSNKGQLVTMCASRMLYLWELKEKMPYVLHTMEFTKEQPTCISHTFGSDWMFVGTDAGNVYVVHMRTFKMSGFTVYWNHALEISYHGSPGEVKTVEVNPMDQSKVLIAFGCGSCVLYDMKYNSSQAVKEGRNDPHKRFCYDPGHSHVLTSTCWIGNGRSFVCAYSNGCVVQWNVKLDSKPEKVFYVDETSDQSAFKPVYKIQAVYTDSEHPWYFCSGGFLGDDSEAPHTLSVLCGKSISMLSSSSTILDFLCLPSSPYHYHCQKPFVLVILSKDELIFHDLLKPGFPKLDSSLFPYALDIQRPPVSSIFYCANCPEEFVGQLHSVRSKTVAAHSKPWPLKGGKWGQEVPHASTDLILTGHEDGSVRLWHCSSVILQPFFTIHTSSYFKKCTSSNNVQSPVGYSMPQENLKKVPPLRPPPPSKPPPQSIKSQLSPSTEGHLSTKTDIGLSSESSSHTQPSTISVGTGTQEQRVNNTPSPATGQLCVESHDLLDGGESTPGEGCTSDSDRRTVFSREKKSIFKKKKNVDSPVSTSDSSKLEVGVHGKDDKRFSPKLASRSFRKVSKIVKLSGGPKKSPKKMEVTKNASEVDATDCGIEISNDEVTSPCHSQTTALSSKLQDSTSGPKRPSNITFRQSSTSKVMTTSIVPPDSGNVAYVQRSGSSSSDDFVHVLLPSKVPPDDSSQKGGLISGKTSEVQGTPTLPKLSEERECSGTSAPAFSCTNSGVTDGEKDFFSINEMHVCMCGQWMCVSNTGGVAMAFEFQLKNKKSPSFVEVNFDSDSLVKQYVPGSAKSPKGSTSLSPTTSLSPVSPEVQSYCSQWVYKGEICNIDSGFQLVQVVSCTVQSSTSRTSGNEGNTSTSDNCSRIPVTISSMKYSAYLGMLAIGTNCGLAVVDTFNNTCLYTLSSLTSILYMADPTKFSRQMKRESQMSIHVSRKATIKRHATSMAFSSKGTERESTGKGVQSSKTFTSAPRAQSQPQFNAAITVKDESDGMVTLSELDSCVSALEVVQLQLDKQSLPTLTLWIGLASGYVVAYAVNMMKGEEFGEAKRKIELVPTRFIVETGQSPIVDLFFLNLWGDCQVVPFYPGRTMSSSSEEKLEHVIKGDRSVLIQQQKTQPLSNYPQHYAIIVDETQLRSFSFPGFSKINNCVPSISKESVILRSDYFSCRDLPCLMSITSCHQLLVHSLPGLKPLMKVHYSPLHEALVMCTFCASGIGHALYLSSPSEIQRLSVVKEDRLNLPNCLPSVYVSKKDPPQTPTGKGILGGLFSSSPTFVNQDLLFGEAARRPIGNVYKLDGNTGTVYSGQKDGIDRTRKGKELEGGHGATPQNQEDISYGKGASVSGQMEQNVEALRIRKEKLSNIEKRTAEVAESASDFANMAARLARKYEKR